MMGSMFTRLGETAAPGSSHSFHDVHRPVQSTSVLHRCQRVAFEDESWYAHEHGEDVVVERLRCPAEKLLPDLCARAEAEGARYVEPGRLDELHDLAALEAHDASMFAAGQGHGHGEPTTDHLHLGVGI